MSEEYRGLSKERLIEVLEEQDQELFDLVAKVIELINVIGWDEDGTYSFVDGDRWARFDPTGGSDDN
jgi:hypothetical protein